MVTEAPSTAPEKRLSAEEVGLDTLTGVWNRAGFVAAATPMLIVCQRRSAPATLGYFDIRSAGQARSAADNAKLNGVLKAVATQMGKTFRDCDVIGRIAPLRFGVLFADCTDDALRAIEGVRAVTDEATPPSAHILSIAMVESSPGATFGDLMREADARSHELRLRDDERKARDAGATRLDEPVWNVLPTKPARPAKRRTRSRR